VLASLEQSQGRMLAAIPAGVSEEGAGRLGGDWLGGEVSLEFILLFSFSGDGWGQNAGLALTHSPTRLKLSYLKHREFEC
jgi:hypothetical protein